MVKLNEAKSVVVLSLGKEILACDSGDKHGPQAQTQQCAAGYFLCGLCGKVHSEQKTTSEYIRLSHRSIFHFVGENINRQISIIADG